MTEPLLDIRNLKVAYDDRDQGLVAVDDVSLQIERGEILGLAGESGSGKSTIAHAILRTLKPPATIRRGKVLFEGRDLLRLSYEQMQSVRWREIALVFQSAMNALNPILRVGAQIVDVISAHESTNARSARRRAGELLDMVGVGATHLDSFPHELSGGMRQRAVIAIALALKPKLLMMDEPTTALDVIVQQAILVKLLELKTQLGFSVLFITHDLSLLFEFADRLAILYAGRVAEVGPTLAVRDAPRHPYTKALMTSFPSLFGKRTALTGIDGTPPELGCMPAGCRFHPRCSRAEARCGQQVPELCEPEANRAFACHFPLVTP